MTTVAPQHAATAYSITSCPDDNRCSTAYSNSIQHTAYSNTCWPEEDCNSTAHSYTSCPDDDFSSTAHSITSCPEDNCSSTAYSNRQQHTAIPAVQMMILTSQHTATPTVQTRTPTPQHTATPAVQQMSSAPQHTATPGSRGCLAPHGHGIRRCQLASRKIRLNQQTNKITIYRL